MLLKTAMVLGLLIALTTHQQQASFSCMIDGQPFSSSGTDGIVNTVMKTAPDILSIGLVSMDPKYKGTVPPQFAFAVSPNGTTTIKGSSGKYTAKYSPAAQLDNDFIANPFTVTITSLTAAGITGTFSGKLSSNAKTITITNGQFTLPVSKYSQPIK